MEDQLSLVLVEDDSQACEDIAAYVNTLDDVVLTGVTNNASKVEPLIQATLPDALILDLELHNGNCNVLLQALQSISASKTPYILITTHNPSPMTYEAARQLGADFILSKHPPDYSAKSVVDFLRALKQVIQTYHVNYIPTPQGRDPEESHIAKEQCLTHTISRELDQVGISPKLKGYRYLTDAISLISKAPTPNLFAVIGGKYGKTKASVERAMQNAIASAWRTTPINTLLLHYTAKVDSEKGIPTLMEFIHYYANKIKNES